MTHAPSLVLLRALPIGVLLLAGTATACAPPAAEPETVVATEPVATQEPEDDADAAETDALEEQAAALDAYVAAAQSQMSEVLAAFDGTFSDIEVVAVHPGTLGYVYTYAQPPDPQAAATTFDANVATLQSTCDSQILPDMARHGISVAPKVTYTYLNPDGSQIWTHTFEPSS